MPSFFTTLLFAGYLYSYFIAKLPPRRAVRIHTLVILVSSICILGEWLWFGTPLLPDTLIFQDERINALPSLLVFLTMLVAVGLPFFILSTTSTITQLWSATINKEGTPYRYYAFSNAASLAGLLAYPFLIEPVFSLHTQAILWGVCFVLYAFFYFLSARAVLHTLSLESGHDDIPNTRGSREHGSIHEFAIWVFLAALPAFLLVATTATITRDVAPIPLLWILPLCAYLISFIVAFGSYRIGVFNSLCTTLFIISALFLSTGIYKHPFVIVVYVLSFFLIALLFHAELYARRGEKSKLAVFYLALSLGGAIGTLGATLVAPAIFTYPLEFPCALVLALMLSLLQFTSLKKFGTTAQRRAVSIGFPLVALLGFLFLTLAQNSDTILMSRNFYGTLRVIERAALGHDGSTRILGHGEIIHGTQFTDPTLARIPTAYFSHTGGAGRALLHLKSGGEDVGLSVGVVGLGVGTLAAYCTSADRYAFYEINDAITDIAYSYFTYLKECPNEHVVSGDARLEMEKEIRTGKPEQYDVLIIDAFSGDSVPAHLLTKEAFALYRARLKDEQSVLLVHITNRYLDLAPVVFASAATVDLPGVLIQDNPEPAVVISSGSNASTWVALSKNTDLLQAISGGPESEASIKAKDANILWTDDASDMLSVVKYFR